RLTPKPNLSKRKLRAPGSDCACAPPANSGTICECVMKLADPTKNPLNRKPANSGLGSPIVCKMLSRRAISFSAGAVTCALGGPEGVRGGCGGRGAGRAGRRRGGGGARRRDGRRSRRRRRRDRHRRSRRDDSRLACLLEPVQPLVQATNLISERLRFLRAEPL